MSRNQETESEEILLKFKPSRILYLGSYIGAILILIIGFILWIDFFSIIPSLSLLGYGLNMWLVLFCLLIAIIIVARAELKRYRTRYKISEYRVFKTVGILRRNTISIPFQKLERCDIIQSWLERMFNVGTVRVDTGEDHFFLRSVRDPNRIDELIFQTGIKKQRSE